MNHFIKLPDGTIINVAHVITVRRFDAEAGFDVPVVSINGTHYNDPHGKIYGYFNGIAQEIGGEK